MSALHASLVWQLNLDATRKLTLLWLADQADHGGNVPAQLLADVAEAIGRNKRTAGQALKDLDEAGLLIRDEQGWLLTIDPEQPVRRQLIEVMDRPGWEPGAVGEAHVDVEPDEPDPVEHPIPYQTDEAGRLIDFCTAWGLSQPSQALVDAWRELEQAEAKGDYTEKHSDGKGERWTEKHAAMDDLLPAILNAVAVFQYRKAKEQRVHAETPVEFVKRQLWLAPDYQIKPGAEPEPEHTEAELDELVQEMNRAGGNMATHFRQVDVKNPHTGELESETLAIYAKRVLAKWNQYQQKGAYFT